MSVKRYFARSLVWSLAAWLAWEALQPVTAAVLEWLATGILRFLGNGVEIDVARANRGGVLFLALYLAHGLGWKPACKAVPIGLAACAFSQALGIATLASVPSHEGALERFLRSVVVGVDKATPLIAWTYFARADLPPLRARKGGPRRRTAAPGRVARRGGARRIESNGRGSQR